MKKTQKGFTLIELLIVIAIIGILASIVLVSLSSAREKAKIAGFKAQAHSLQAAAVLQCDTAALQTTAPTAVGYIKEPASGSYITAITNANITAGTTTAVCGPTGTGNFSINVTATGITGACNTTNTVISPTGVAFPAGC